MWIDLNDDECAPMIYQIKDSSGENTGQQKIVIPAFDLYSKKIVKGKYDWQSKRISKYTNENSRRTDR